MSDFFQDMSNRLNRPRVTRNCADCGREFQTITEQDCCLECEYLREHPLERTKVWTWARVGAQWGIAAYWPERAPLPEVGETVTVNRKDGSSSAATIREVEGIRYLPTGQGRLYCYVSRPD